MDPRDFMSEARRWAKFPATILFITGFIWLLHVIFTSDINQIGSQSETGIGAVGVLCNLALVPLGSMVVALALLYIQRWSFLPAIILPLYPLVVTTISLVGKVQRKFGEYRSEGIENSFGDGVMTALLIIALWVLFVLMAAYVLRSQKYVLKGQEWLSRPAAANRRSIAADESDEQDEAEETESEFDPLFPIFDHEPDSDD